MNLYSYCNSCNLYFLGFHPPHGSVSVVGSFGEYSFFLFFFDTGYYAISSLSQIFTPKRLEVGQVGAAVPLPDGMLESAQPTGTTAENRFFFAAPPSSWGRLWLVGKSQSNVRHTRKLPAPSSTSPAQAAWWPRDTARLCGAGLGCSLGGGSLDKGYLGVSTWLKESVSLIMVSRRTDNEI